MHRCKITSFQNSIDFTCAKLQKGHYEDVIIVHQLSFREAPCVPVCIHVRILYIHVSNDKLSLVHAYT